MCGVSVYSGRSARNSAVLDHLEPWRLSPAKAKDPENTQLVCKQCHDTVCARIEAQHAGDATAIAQEKLSRKVKRVGLDGYPIT